MPIILTIFGFLRPQWLRERASILRCTKVSQLKTLKVRSKFEPSLIVL